MTKIEIYPTAEWIKENFENTLLLVNKFNLTNLGTLLSTLGERYAICPCSTRKEYYSSFPGGLAYHNLHVLKWMNKLTGILCEPSEISKESMLKVAILHEIGKVGDVEKDYYVRQDNDYHNQRGMYYEVNSNIQYMKIADRSLYWVHESHIHLTTDEYLAILLHDGQNDEENASYKYKEPKLAILLQQAEQYARRLEKDSIIHWPE